MQPRKILLLDDAVDDLRAIRRDVYLVSKSHVVADGYVKKLRKGMRHLAYTAAACRKYVTDLGFETEYRFCSVEHYIAFFIIDEETVFIDRILSSRQDFDSTMLN